MAEFWRDFQYLGYAPALHLGQGAGFHDLDFVTKGALIFFIMCVYNGLTLDLFFVERVRDLVRVGGLYGLIA